MGNKLTQYLIIFLCCSCASQKPVVTTTYLRISDPDETFYCQKTELRLLLSNKRVILQNHLVNINLKVFSRAKKEWLAKDSTDTYHITGVSINGEPGVIITPEDGTKLQYMISKSGAMCYEN